MTGVTREYEDRLERIESKLGLAEDQIDALNQTVFRQQQQIDLLQEALRRMHAQLQDARAASGDPKDEVPPHY